MQGEGRTRQQQRVPRSWVKRTERRSHQKGWDEHPPSLSDWQLVKWGVQKERALPGPDRTSVWGRDPGAPLRAVRTLRDVRLQALPRCICGGSWQLLVGKAWRPRAEDPDGELAEEVALETEEGEGILWLAHCVCHKYSWTAVGQSCQVFLSG